MKPQAEAKATAADMPAPEIPAVVTTAPEIAAPPIVPQLPAEEEDLYSAKNFTV